MACDLTSGRTLACRDSKGGIKAVWFTELVNKNTLSSTTDGTIDTFTLDSTKQFFKYEIEKETSSFTDTPTVDPVNGTFFSDQALTVILNKGDATTRNQIKLLAQNRLMAIVLDRNGVYWLLGEINGLDLTTAPFETGTAFGDRNGYTLNFVGKEENMAQTVSSSLIATLEAPAV